MTIVYIAHPIGGDIKGNLEKIKRIARDIMIKHPDIVPFAPYWLDCHALNDNDPQERARGIRNDVEFFKRRTMDQVWLCGGRISPGMQAEKELAEKLGIPVIDKLDEYNY